ncbi:hypothetical protein B0H13DRAFT_1897792 [Mycena leptocephala]|nr:hypothetical protein B0H13DRAFT_1897792 [Mycena leptocephala]
MSSTSVRGQRRSRSIGNMIIHMHTMETVGNDTDLTKDLENPITWIPPLDGNDNDAEEDIVEKASKYLEQLLNDEAPIELPEGSVVAGQIVDFAEFAHIERGEMAGIEEDDVDIVGEEVAGGWSVEDLISR